MLYFAYGSNLDPEQMARRCPGSRAHARAVRPGYRLIFPVTASDWAGGVASIAPDPAELVRGVIYSLTGPDLVALDEYEAVAEGVYRREPLAVQAEGQRWREVWTYFANPAPAGPTPPSPQYLAALVRGARAHQLDEAYIAMLQRIPTRQSVP